jgi:hypothetical protein
MRHRRGDMGLFALSPRARRVRAACVRARSRSGRHRRAEFPAVLGYGARRGAVI